MEATWSWRPSNAIGVPVALSQHPDQHGSERSVLLAVDQQFGAGATLGVAPELSDPIGPLEVWEHEDVEQFGTATGGQGGGVYNDGGSVTLNDASSITGNIPDNCYPPGTC